MTLFSAIRAVRKFFGKTDGASGIEYAIVAAMVAVVIAGFMTGMNGGLTNVFTKITNALPAASTPASGS